MLLAAVRPLSAQQRMLIGPTAEVEYGVPLTVDREPGLVNSFGVSGLGRSYNLTGAAGIRLDATGFLGGSIRSSAALTLALSTGSFTSNPYTVSEAIDTSAVLRETEREFGVYTTLSMLRLDLMPMAFEVGGLFDIGVGAWGSYRLNSGFIETERLRGPAGIAFPDGTTSRTVLAGEELGAARFRWGVTAAIDRRITSTPSAFITPFATIRLDVQALIEGTGLRRATSGGIGLALLLDPSPEVPAPIPAAELDTSRQDLPSERLSIRLHALDSAGGRLPALHIRSAGYRHRVQAPVAEFIGFDQGSATLPSYVEMIEAGETAGFSMISLARLEPTEIRRHSLNIIASRLRDEPKGKLTVTGTAGWSEGDGETVTRRRAEAVRGYLTDVWGIQPARVEVVIEAAGKRRAGVGLRSSSPGLLRPAVVEWIVNRLETSPISLVKSVDASDDRPWTVTFLQNGETVGSFSREDEKSGSRPEGSFGLDEGSTFPLIAELTVRNPDGSIDTARDELPLSVTGRQGSPVVEQEYLSTIILPGPTPERMREEVAATASALRSGAVITIAPLPPAEGTPSEDRLPTGFVSHVAAMLLEELSASSIAIRELRATGSGERGGGALITVRQPVGGSLKQ